MKKILALMVAAAMVFSIATVSLAAPKKEETKKPTKSEQKAKATKVKKPSVKKPSVKKPSKSGKFVVFQGTTTAKAHIRILVGKKTVAAGLADKKGNFKIKVLASKLKSEVTIYAYTKVKGKIQKSDSRRVAVPVTLLPQPEPTPEPTVVPEPTVAPVETPIPAE